MDKFDVVAAIIIKDGKYFIAQRNRNKHMGLSWEFPGGKVEKGETFEIALKREIKEELNIDIDIKNKALAGVGKPSKKLLFSSAKLNLASLITEKIKIRNEKYLRSVSDNSAI